MIRVALAENAAGVRINFRIPRFHFGARVRIKLGVETLDAAEPNSGWE